MRIIFLKLFDFVKPLSLDKYSQGTTKSDFHNVCFEVIVCKSEIEVSFGILFDTWNECLLKQMIPQHLSILNRVLIHWNSFVKTLIIIQIVLLIFPSQADTHLSCL
jgi:hypothetical protein